MVFFIVACHLAGKEDEQVEQVLRNQCIGQGSKALGEVYSVDVSHSYNLNSYRWTKENSKLEPWTP